MFCVSDTPSYDLEAKYKDVLVVRSGGVIKLSVPIKGKPTPTSKWTKDGSEVTNRAMIASNEDVSELVIKQAERSDSGVYYLHLENKCGKKMLPIKVKVIGRPSAPEGPLGFDDIQAHSVRVSWKPPTEDGASEIVGYIVERREVTKAAWYTVDSRVVDTSLVVKGLEENVEYHFKVTAENQFGISNSLKSEGTVVPKTPICKHLSFVLFLGIACLLLNIIKTYIYLFSVILGVPEASGTPPEIMDVTKSSAALAWTKPKDDGGSCITGYFIEYKEVLSDKWIRHETKITSTMYTLSQLTTDAEYQFRVIAVNDIGESEPGPTSDSVICKDPFGMTTFLFCLHNMYSEYVVCSLSN